MTNPQVAILMLGLFIVIVLFGFPIAFTLVAMGLGFGYYAYYDAERMQSIFDLFVQNTFSVMSNEALVAVPLFLFMVSQGCRAAAGPACGDIPRHHALSGYCLAVDGAIAQFPGDGVVASRLLFWLERLDGAGCNG